jgi:phospholipid-binding lipoprotein MlaA
LKSIDYSGETFAALSRQSYISLATATKKGTTMRYPSLNLFLLACIAMLASGCVSVKGPPNKLDPLESYNRTMFKINDSVDRAVLKPVSRTYDKITPSPLKKGFKNFFSNIGEIPVVFNDLLQLKFQQAAYDTSRFFINSILGLGGFLDIAADAGLEKHDEDFGQTLGKWGVPSGPYFVIPILGPSTIRDSVSKLADAPLKPLGYVTPDGAKYGLYAADGVVTRASFLGASNVLGEAALDPYVFVRDAFLQRRLKAIYDGKVPQAKLDELEEAQDPIDTKPEPKTEPKVEKPMEQKVEPKADAAK